MCYTSLWPILLIGLIDIVSLLVCALGGFPFTSFSGEFRTLVDNVSR